MPRGVIESLDHEARGITRLEGKTVFVEGALPGETVQIKDGQILINGEVYNEKDEFPAITNAGLASEPITVGKGQYFVLGDNRNNSEDSRHNGMGLVDSDRIVGKLWFTISPWKKIGFV